MLKTKSSKSERKLIWATTRSVLETDHFKYKRHGQKSKSHWSSFKRILNFALWGTKILGLYQKGYRNALKIERREETLYFSQLPDKFDGFKILHLSDLHIDSLPELMHALIHEIDQVDFDLAVLTGDYRKEHSGEFTQILEPMKEVSRHLQKEFMPLAVLGNHDTWLMTEYEEELGIHFLINESIELKRGGQGIIISGTDDPFSFYTDAALEAFSDQHGFKIALVHTSELADIADGKNYQFYMCGHTHGGQVCLPGGKALISHQKEGKEFIKGFWKWGKMLGYTSRGCGVSGVPLRFNCPGEICVFTLRKKI